MSDLMTSHINNLVDQRHERGSFEFDFTSQEKALTVDDFIDRQLAGYADLLDEADALMKRIEVLQTVAPKPKTAADVVDLLDAIAGIYGFESAQAALNGVTTR